MGGRNSHEVVREYVTDPEVIKHLAELRKQNSELVAQLQKIKDDMLDKNIDSFEDLQKFDENSAAALVKLAIKIKALPMEGKNFGFFGLTSTGKSTMINKLIGQDVAEVGAGETTTIIQSFEGQDYRLYDIPGRNDEISYFSMEYISFWKGLTARLVVITATVKEMTKVLRLLDAIDLKYDIVINKFDDVPLEERDKFKAKIQEEVQQAGLKGVNRMWFLSAKNPNQFPDWLKMVDCLTK